MIATDYIKEGHPKVTVLDVVGLSRSTYYYKPKNEGGRKGRTNSEYTFTKSGEQIHNETVIEDIKRILSQEFVDYGYLKVTHWLRQEMGYLINPKKVYRLMKETYRNEQNL